MKKTTICFVFSGGKGHAYVNIVPSNYGMYKQDFSGCHDFFLKPGDYSIFIEGVAPANGATASVAVEGGDAVSKTIKPGQYSRVFNITV